MPFGHGSMIWLCLSEVPRIFELRFSISSLLAIWHSSRTLLWWVLLSARGLPVGSYLLEVGFYWTRIGFLSGLVVPARGIYPSFMRCSWWIFRPGGVGAVMIWNLSRTCERLLIGWLRYCQSGSASGLVCSRSGDGWRWAAHCWKFYRRVFSSTWWRIVASYEGIRLFERWRRVSGLLMRVQCHRRGWSCWRFPTCFFSQCGGGLSEILCRRGWSWLILWLGAGLVWRYGFGDIFPERLLGVESLFVPVAHECLLVVSLADLLDVGHAI